MAEFRLHGCGQSGSAYKAALMLELCGADWEVVPVRFFAGQTHETVWRQYVNNMGEVPVLEHAGQRFSQSGVILDYLAETLGKFGPRDSAERREIWRWILFDNHKFTSCFATLRFLVGLQKTGETPVTEFLRGRTRSAWSVLDRHLQDQQWVAANRPTIADISLAGYLYYDKATGFDRAEFQQIARWANSIRAFPRWKGPYELMPRAIGL